ncbi:MAG: hypothetical protein PHH26_00915 [Candidatus Thermoplasmatota archaeon]|nr:hypothetical protein [Candidatus Thermoplasmatota archaeon]
MEILEYKQEQLNRELGQRQSEEKYKEIDRKISKFYLDLFLNQYGEISKKNEGMALAVKQLLLDVNLLYKNNLILAKKEDKRNRKEIDEFLQFGHKFYGDQRVHDVLRSSEDRRYVEIMGLADMLMECMKNSYSMFYPKRYNAFFDYVFSNRLNNYERPPTTAIQNTIFSIYLPDLGPLNIQELIKIRESSEFRNFRKDVQRESVLILEGMDKIKSNQFEEYIKDTYQKQLDEFLMRRTPSPKRFLFKQAVSNALPAVGLLMGGMDIYEEFKDKNDFPLLTSSIEAKRMLKEKSNKN